LATSRHCALLGISPRETPVWAKDDAVFFQCPESLLTGELYYWLSLEALLRNEPNTPWLNLPAVDCDAMQTIWRLKGNINGDDRQQREWPA
jgi:hypothetical protein